VVFVDGAGGLEFCLCVWYIKGVFKVFALFNKTYLKKYNFKFKKKQIL
jgi:hypothetical protein